MTLQCEEYYTRIREAVKSVENSTGPPSHNVASCNEQMTWCELSVSLLRALNFLEQIDQDRVQ